MVNIPPFSSPMYGEIGDGLYDCLTNIPLLSFWGTADWIWLISAGEIRQTDGNSHGHELLMKWQFDRINVKPGSIQNRGSSMNRMNIKFDRRWIRVSSPTLSTSGIVRNCKSKVDIRFRAIWVRSNTSFSKVDGCLWYDVYKCLWCVYIYICTYIYIYVYIYIHTRIYVVHWVKVNQFIIGRPGSLQGLIAPIHWYLHITPFVGGGLTSSRICFCPT